MRGVSISLLSCALLARDRASDVRAEPVSRQTDDLQHGIYHSTDALSCDQARRNRISHHLKARCVPPLPNPRHNGAHGHRSAIERLRQHERQRNAHHIGMPVADPLKTAAPAEVLNEDHGRPKKREGERESGGGGRDGKGRVSDGDGDGAPRRDAGRGERAPVLHRNHARVRPHEQHEHRRRHEHCGRRADRLRRPLLYWWRVQ